MADGLGYTAGAGSTILTDDTGAGGHAQVVKLAIATDGSGTLIPADANGLLVNLGTNNDVTIATLPALVAGSANIGDVDVLTVPAPLSTTGGGTEATALRVTLASDSTGLVSVDDNSASLSVDWNGTQPVTGSGTATGALRVELPTNGTGVVGLIAGSATVGNVGIIPQTSGGFTTYHLVSAATTNATSVKASAGQLFGWYIYNNAASMRKLAFHNTAGTPTAGASIFFTINVPAASAANAFNDVGIAFGTGIGITTVTDVTDAGATAVSVSDLTINLFYK